MAPRIIHVTVISLLLSIFPLSAHAIPVLGDYSINSTILTGTFHSDGTALTDWEFFTIPDGQEFSLARVVALDQQVLFNQDDLFSKIVVGTGFPRLRIEWEGSIIPGFHHIIYQNASAVRVDDLNATASPVPVPNSLMLMATGLFGLAGYRWQQWRHGKTQEA